MFLPYRTDLEFTRAPWVTWLVCVLCIVVFYQQKQSDHEVIVSAEQFCQRDHPRLFWTTMKKLAGAQAEEACPHLLMAIHSSGRADEAIANLAEQAQPWDLMNRDESRAYTAQRLQVAYHDFQFTVRPSLTEQLVYKPDTYNVWHMITAAFAHGGVGHIVGNLIFFYAFATTVEVIIGPLAFTGMILLLAVGTHVCYSLSQALAATPIPTLGLSGVVMGMIGLFAYLAPTARIRCVLWLLVLWRVLRVPAWLLALWYVGWDIYNLTHDDGSSNTNFVAHVSGAAIGYLSGLAMFRARKHWVSEQLGMA